MKDKSQPVWRTPDCGEIKCCKCGHGCVLYWLNNAVWSECNSKADCCGGHLCLKHAEDAIDRQLNLSDLDIDAYLRTSNNSDDEEHKKKVLHCVYDTVVGAAHAAKIQLHPDWCYMWQDYYDLGKKLSEQTDNVKAEVSRLIAETEKHFPDFTNPYMGDPI